MSQQIDGVVFILVLVSPSLCVEDHHPLKKKPTSNIHFSSPPFRLFVFCLLIVSSSIKGTLGDVCVIAKGMIEVSSSLSQTHPHTGSRKNEIHRRRGEEAIWSLRREKGSKSLSWKERFSLGCPLHSLRNLLVNALPSRVIAVLLLLLLLLLHFEGIRGRGVGQGRPVYVVVYNAWCYNNNVVDDDDCIASASSWNLTPPAAYCCRGLTCPPLSAPHQHSERFEICCTCLLQTKYRNPRLKAWTGGGGEETGNTMASKCH